MPHHEMDRLARAMELALATGADQRQRLLAEHPDLQDLLEPLLAQGDDAAAPAAPTQRQLGEFTLLRELGRGGMGVVYEALQPGLGRRVALKVLPAHLTQSPASIARFRREAHTAAQLEHPGLVRILATGSDAEHHWFAMELVAGASLDRILEHLRGLPRGELRGTALAAALVAAGHADAATQPFWSRGHIETVVELVAQVADALAHAHAHGVLHRDVKPSNLLVRPDGTAVLGDFGLARDLAEPGLTQSGALGGTPHYLSPEQVQGRGAESDGRSDVFALGVTLYECLTLVRPFDAATSQAVIQQVLTRDPRPPEDLNPAVPADLAAIVLQAMAKEPARRYASAAALAEDLRAFLAGRPVRARRAGALERVRRWVRREPRKAVLVGALLLALLGLAATSGFILARWREFATGRERLAQERLELLVEGAFGALDRLAFARAERAFADLAAAAPDLPETLAGRALLALQRRQPQAALELLDHEPAQLERFPGLRLLRAAALRGLRRSADADAVTAALPPLATALDLFIAGRWESRRGQLRQTDAWPQAIAHLALATRLAPLPRRLYYRAWADALAEAGDAAGRRECALTLERLWPALPSMWHPIAALWRTVDPARARTWLEREPPPDAVTAPFFVRRGKVWHDLGEIARARADFQRAIDLEPDDAIAHYNLGVALRAAHEPEPACAAWRRVLELDPDHHASLYNIAGIDLDQGRVAEAITALRRVVELEPEFADAWSNLGFAFGKLGRDKAEIQALRHALDVDPRHATAHDNLLVALNRTRDFAGFRAESERWCALFPEDEAAAFQLVQVLIHVQLNPPVRDPVRGRALAEQLARSARHRPWEALAWLARAQAACGDPATAWATMTAACALVPPDLANATALRTGFAQEAEAWRAATSRPH